MKRRVLEKLKLTEISGVDRPCQQHATVAIMKRAPDDIALLSKRLKSLQEQAAVLKVCVPNQKGAKKGKKSALLRINNALRKANPGPYTRDDIGRFAEGGGGSRSRMSISPDDTFDDIFGSPIGGGGRASGSDIHSLQRQLNDAYNHRKRMQVAYGQQSVQYRQANNQVEDLKAKVWAAGGNVGRGDDNLSRMQRAFAQEEFKRKMEAEVFSRFKSLNRAREALFADSPSASDAPAKGSLRRAVLEAAVGISQSTDDIRNIARHVGAITSTRDLGKIGQHIQFVLSDTKSLINNIQALPSNLKEVKSELISTAKQTQARAKLLSAQLRAKGVKISETVRSKFTSTKKKFDPDQKRDDHGRWTVGGAVAAVGRSLAAQAEAKRQLLSALSPIQRVGTYSEGEDVLEVARRAASAPKAGSKAGHAVARAGRAVGRAALATAKNPYVQTAAAVAAPFVVGAAAHSLIGTQYTPEQWARARQHVIETARRARQIHSSSVLDRIASTKTPNELRAIEAKRIVDAKRKRDVEAKRRRASFTVVKSRRRAAALKRVLHSLECSPAGG